MNSFQIDVDEYEAWLRRHCQVVESDLNEKHRRMRKDVFGFLRSTYFRWARTIESVCPDLVGDPVVACVGDIHVGNFGTWRDADARLVWGVNDYDEVAFMPYAYDLVRLATSALLSPKVTLGISDAVAAVLEGYRTGLADPRAVLLDQHADWLRSFANPTEQTNRVFWSEINACSDAVPPKIVRSALFAQSAREFQDLSIRVANERRWQSLAGRDLS